jgi:hypothetical protein
VRGSTAGVHGCGAAFVSTWCEPLFDTLFDTLFDLLLGLLFDHAVG